MLGGESRCLDWTCVPVTDWGEQGHVPPHPPPQRPSLFPHFCVTDLGRLRQGAREGRPESPSTGKTQNVWKNRVLEVALSSDRGGSWVPLINKQNGTRIVTSITGTAGGRATKTIHEKKPQSHEIQFMGKGASETGEKDSPCKYIPK